MLQSSALLTGVDASKWCTTVKGPESGLFIAIMHLSPPGLELVSSAAQVGSTINGIEIISITLSSVGIIY